MLYDFRCVFFGHHKSPSHCSVRSSVPVRKMRPREESGLWSLGLQCKLSLPSLALRPSCAPPLCLSSHSLSKRNASVNCRHGQHDFISFLHTLASCCCMTDRHKLSSSRHPLVSSQCRGQKCRCRAAGFSAQSLRRYRVPEGDLG